MIRILYAGCGILNFNNFQRFFRVGEQLPFLNGGQNGKGVARMLRLSGIHYHFRDNAAMPSGGETNFTLDEATTALACLARESTCELITRIETDPDSLWSFEVLTTEDEFQLSRYHSIFQPERSAREVWRAVQVQRIVLQTIKPVAESEFDPTQQPTWQARWLLLHLLFDRLHLESSEGVELNTDEVSHLICTLERYSQLLLKILDEQGWQDIMTETLFCDVATCTELRKAMQSQLHL